MDIVEVGVRMICFECEYVVGLGGVGNMFEW